jgi:hypothetical protein
VAPDPCPPRLDVLDFLEAMDHLAARKKLAVVMATADARDEALDASSDVDGIVHDVPELMMPDPRPGTRICRSEAR